MTKEEHELEALRAGIQIPPSELKITDLVPVFVPSTFFALGNWPGPYEMLGVPGLGLTWSVLRPEQTMRYVDREAQAYWESSGIAWRERALQNLRQRSHPTPWTHEFRRDGRTLFGVAMMQSDGTGPSRLLLGDALELAFPDGYLVALPEMSCGIALSATASDSERAKIGGIVASCFGQGTRPLVPGVYDAALLEGERVVR